MAFQPRIRIRIVEFYTKAKEKTEGKLWLGPDGKPIYEDWVAYSSIGQTDEVRALVRHLEVKDHDYNPNIQSHAIAKARWDYIRPAYEAWKRGEEVPDKGTPLAMANFLRKEDLQGLKRNGIRTLEEFIDLPEQARDKIQVPRVRDLQKEAKAFLDAQDANKAAEEIRARDAQIATLEERLKALEAALVKPEPATLPQNPGILPPEIIEKRGPGRPPKEKTE